MTLLPLHPSVLFLKPQAHRKVAPCFPPQPACIEAGAYLESDILEAIHTVPHQQPSFFCILLPAVTLSGYLGNNMHRPSTYDTFL